MDFPLSFLPRARQRGRVKEMARWGWVTTALVIWIGLQAVLVSQAQETTTRQEEPAASAGVATAQDPGGGPAVPELSAVKFPGIVAAEAISQITGIAISPALGVASVGAWRYYHTTPTRRAQLPWWGQPWFWGPALAVVLLVFVKDAAGPFIPKVLKKPLDALELFENKFSALLATGAIIPLAWTIFQSVAPAQDASLASMGFAAIDLGPLWGVLGVPLVLVAYVAVFLVAHVIQVLILLSPFGTVDAALKSIRLFMLTTVAVTSLASPALGALWSGVIILACLPLAGWAFRWLTFGHVFAWDLLTLHRRRFLPTVTANRAFLSRKLGRAPRRTYGQLERTEAGELVFRYRPWHLMAARTEPLSSGRFAIGRGLLHPELLQLEGAIREEKVTEILDFPPRYSGHEKLLGQAYGVTEIREVGVRAMWVWIRDRLGGGDAKPVTVTVKPETA